MSWRIKKIIIENFKFFHDAFPLDVDSKNLLVYGENGSGKSSIYWALYTLFQSRLKPDAASVEKYFNHLEDENLRNKYSADGDNSKVEVIFEDKSNAAAIDKPYVITLGNVSTQVSGDTFLDFTTAASDFLNYKMLSKLTDKDNSVVNDVTDLFVKEIYPFANFQNDYIDLDGNHSGIINAKKWHEYILSSLGDVEHQKGRRRKHFDKKGVKYGRYTAMIKKFRDQLALYLNDISFRATTKLETEFDIKDVEVILETDPEYEFDKPTSLKNRDHSLHPLHIRLQAKLKNAQLTGGEADIVHMRTFFNEAKLTCIGLAIRMAVVDKKFIAGGNLASVLCLDDMLVSLDMGYRVPVTRAMMKYALNYQLCIFTHDRSLYNMMRGTIKELGYAESDWKFLEFYHPDPATEGALEPCVNYVEVKDYKDRIKKYMLCGDYPSAGNHLRKYAEDLIKGLLPQNLTYRCNKDGTVESLLLRALYEKTKSTAQGGFCDLYDITPAIMPDISKHLDRLMNPLSHDNKDVPIFRRELDDALAEIEKYEPIKAGKKVIVKRNEAGVKRFKLEMTNGADTRNVVFVTTEQWDYILFPMPTGKKYKDCEVMIVSSSDGHYTLESKIRIKKLYSDLANRVFHGLASAPAFDQAITEIVSGDELRVL